MRRGSTSSPAASTGEMPAKRMPERPPSNTGFQPEERSQKSTVAPKIMDWIIAGAIYLLTFLTPLFFLPNVPSVLELNKQMLLVLLGGIAFLAWIGKLAWEGKIRIKKNFLLVPILLLLIILSLSTVFSVYRDQSMWGAFGTESLSLTTFIALIAVFLVVTNNFNSRTKISGLVLALIGSSALAALFTIFQIFGKFIFNNSIVAQNSFNTVGSVYAFSFFIGAILILTTAAILEKKPTWLKIALVVIAMIFVFTLIVINFRTSLIIFLVGMAIFLGLSIIVSGNEEKNKTLILPMVILALVLISTLIGKSGGIVSAQLPVEVGLSQGASYDVAKVALKEKSLLGFGLSNYDLGYLQGKPAEINNTDFWSVKFNEASSRFLTLVTSTGMLGTIAFLFLIGSMAVYIFKMLIKIFGKKEDGIYTLLGITAAWIYLTLSMFFYASNVTLDFSWWILMAAFATLAAIVFQKEDDIISETSSPRVSLILSFVFVIIIVGFISLIFLEGQKYAAAAMYNKALQSDAKGENLEGLIEQLDRVANLDPSRDLFHRNLSVAFFAFLNQKVSEKGLQNLSDEDRANVSNLYFEAERQANAAITLNPRNPDNYVQLAQINQNVIGSKDGAEESALNNYRAALKNSPQDPSIYYQIGQVYLSMTDIEISKASQAAGKQVTSLPDKAKENLVLAKQNFEKAVQIKSNYIPAQFMIAVVLQRQGEIDQAIAKLEESLKMNPRDTGISFQLGVLYFQTGKYEQARITLESTVKLTENYSNAMYFLGLTYDKLGDKQKALEQFQKVSELNPDNADLKKIVSNLQTGKKALDGLEQAPAGQNPNGQSSGENSVQREQQPVPPNTPIDSGQPPAPQPETEPEQNPVP